eukprot:snap_masked-scaffold_8-processed-gene-3.34-mRNA-1 protein AED:1.00 eAED:1.00 QI:0/0/0/0/1/1/2/0/336
MKLFPSSLRNRWNLKEDNYSIKISIKEKVYEVYKIPRGRKTEKKTTTWINEISEPRSPRSPGMGTAARQNTFKKADFISYDLKNVSLPKIFLKDMFAQTLTYDKAVNLYIACTVPSTLEATDLFTSLSQTREIRKLECNYFNFPADSKYKALEFSNRKREKSLSVHHLSFCKCAIEEKVLSFLSKPIVLRTPFILKEILFLQTKLSQSDLYIFFSNIIQSSAINFLVFMRFTRTEVLLPNIKILSTLLSETKALENFHLADAVTRNKSLSSINLRGTCESYLQMAGEKVLNTLSVNKFLNRFFLSTKQNDQMALIQAYTPKLLNKLQQLKTTRVEL